MSKEEIEKAKDRIKILLKDDCNCSECIKNKKAYEVLLQYIEQLEQENKKQNKMIDEMVKVIIASSICDYFIKDNCKHSIEYDKTLEKLQKDSISKEKIKNKIREQIEEADDVLVGKEYIDNFDGSEENQEYYYNGYKDASLFIRDILED